MNNMNYSVLPSLHRAATVRTASLLYADCEMDRMGEDRTNSCNRVSVEKKVSEKLSSLVPSTLLSNIAETILHLHQQAEAWKYDHRFLLPHVDSSCSSWLYWKTDGTIDRIRTAKGIVSSGSIDTKIRFVIACTYFLEEAASSLYDRLDEVEKSEISRAKSNGAVRFWIEWLKNRHYKDWNEMVNRYMGFTNARRTYLPLRLSSFYHFLSRENKERYRKSFGFLYLHYDDFTECVNKMPEEERIETFHSQSKLALLICLKWPFRSLFLKMANSLIDNLTPSEFSVLLSQMIHAYMSHGDEDFHLFEQFWQMSSSALKEKTKALNYFRLVMKKYLEKENCPQDLKEMMKRCFSD